MRHKIAVIGTGQVARANYLPFLTQQEDVDLVCFSRTRSKADQCALDFGDRIWPGLAGLEELQFEVALRRAIEQGRPVKVQEEFPLKD